MHSLAELIQRSGEADHRIRNSLQLATSFLTMEAARQPPRSGAGQVLTAAAARIHAIAEAHALLSAGGHPAQVEINAYLSTLSAHLSKAFAIEGGAELKVSPYPVLILMSPLAARTVGLIVTELVINAFKHAFDGREGGMIKVALDRPPPRRIVLSVSDNGAGILANDHDGPLFGRGHAIIDALADQLGTELIVRSGSTGTVWVLDLTEWAAEIPLQYGLRT
jgi:two-component sensor histidine kinase